MQFGQNLEKIMIEKGITKYRLAKEIGVHPTTVKNWIDGKTKPNFEMVKKLAIVLKVMTVDLLEAIAIDENAPLYTPYEIIAKNYIKTNPVQAYEIIFYYSSLNDEGKKELLVFINYLLQRKEYLESDCAPDEE